ncbi:MAG TPA: ABC transporter permease, partial [Saprospiraceae bacterium]|nr:ABC transporter permease [Saprospiraceae bacterium]
GITYLLLPYCNNIADKKLRLDWSDPSLMLLTAGILGGALLLSSIYPAVILSAFNPLQTIKSQFTNGNDRQARLRQALVVTQFVCSSALLLAMFIVNRQMQFIRNQNLGFDRENVFQMRLTELTYKNRDAIISELKSSPGVVAVTSSSDNIMQSGSSTGDTDWDGKTADQHMIVAPMAIGPDYLDFFKMTLTAGSNFTGTKADSTSFIINETAAAQLGMADPVGKRFKLWQTEGTIIGVVKDYHFASLHETIKPAILFSAPNRHGVICVKTTGAEASKAVASAEKQWKRFDPAYPFEFKFMDESFDKMYRTEQRATQLFRAFSVIALLISCLGLFGLSAFMAEQRTKEIGIRKVLGSSISGITALLARDFLKPVLLAFVIATPLAWYFMREWLSDFAYRTEIQWWIFAVVGLATVAVAFLTVCFQSIRAALANPVKSLRSE